MKWVLEIPNQKNHPLHKATISNRQIVELSLGDLYRDLEQMSRIYKLMLRYSAVKAKQFLKRFPKVYYLAQGSIPILYYREMESDKVCEQFNPVIQWKIDHRKRVYIFNTKVEDSQLLVSGLEFPIFIDKEARFQGIKTKYKSSSQVEEKESKKELKKKLGIKYNWKDEGSKQHIEWIKSTLPQLLNEESSMVAISQCAYEIHYSEHCVGIVYLMDGVIYISWLTSPFLGKILKTIDHQRIIERAKEEDIALTITNTQ